MPKQTETLSVFLPTRSDEADFPYSAAATGLLLPGLGSLLSCPGYVFGRFLSLCNPLLFSPLKTVLSCQAQTEQAPTAPEVWQQQQTLQSAVCHSTADRN